MPQIYKVCVLNNLNDNSNEVFAVKPYLESFDSFKDEIFIRMPELKNQQFRIYYEDEEGDKITIFNALDFGIFQEQKIKKVFLVKNGTAKSVQFQERRNVAVDASASASSAASNAASAPQNRVLHPNVICDECDKSIYGYRYKCLECADFDLCMECEPKSHNHHLMIRIADPGDADICYRSKLGKRFLRHRRSESLCMKSDEKEKEKDKRHHYGHHHKRHASSAGGVRPPTVGDVLCNVLRSFAAGPNEANAQNNNPSGGTETNKPTANAAAGSGSQTQQKTPSPSSTNANQTPINPPAYGFNFANPNSNGKPPCVPLKHGIDMLSHVAQNFAAMMDPFAAFLPEANVGVPTTTSTQTAATAAAAAVNSATEAVRNAEVAAKVAAAAAAAAAMAANQTNEETEPLIGVATADESLGKNGEQPKRKEQDCMIVDCSDDDEEDLRNLVTSMNVSRKSSGDATAAAPAEANKKDERSGSIDADKGSPSREWTFIDTNEIAESVGAVASNGGAIPKKTTPPPSAPADDSNTNNKVDYAELSRLLSTHIVAQNQATPSASTQTDEAKAQSDVADNAAKSAKTPPPTPMHPDARVNESLNAMMAMGFSNEGGWLTQLLETVDGSISNALDLLQPHK